MPSALSYFFYILSDDPLTLRAGAGLAITESRLVLKRSFTNFLDFRATLVDNAAIMHRISTQNDPSFLNSSETGTFVECPGAI